MLRPPDESPPDESPADEYDRRIEAARGLARRRLREALVWWAGGQAAVGVLVLAGAVSSRSPDLRSAVFLFLCLAVLAWLVSFGGAAVAAVRVVIDYSILAPRWIAGGVIPWFVVASEMLTLCLIPGI
jgi:hypothetical protein